MIDIDIDNLSPVTYGLFTLFNGLLSAAILFVVRLLYIMTYINAFEIVYF